MEKFTYKINERGNATVTYVGDKNSDTILPRVEKHVVIPSMIDGYIVDEISEEGFTLCEYSLSVYIPKTITKIGKNAFKGCINLVIYFEIEDFNFTNDLDDGDVSAVYYGINKCNLIRNEEFDFVIKDDKTASIVHYNGEGGHQITISNSISFENKIFKVTELGDATFENPNIFDTSRVIIPSQIKYSETIFNRFENVEIINL